VLRSLYGVGTDVTVTQKPTRPTDETGMWLVDSDHAIARGLKVGSTVTGTVRILVCHGPRHKGVSDTQERLTPFCS
jgi:hypothetical protein